MLITEKNRIALISVTGDPAIEKGREDVGCQNVYVRQVGIALAERGWQVDMFTRRTSREQPAIVEHKPNCRTIRLMAGPAQFLNSEEIFGYLPQFVKAFQAFEQREGMQYSLIHTNYWLSAAMGMELKKRHSRIQVHTHHSLATGKYRPASEVTFAERTRLTIEKACLETVDRAIATSPQEQKHLREVLSKKGSIEMIPCGTDIDKFGAIGRQEARKKLGIPSEAKVVIYVGRFDRRKGIETLVRAVGKSNWRDRDGLRLILAGSFHPGENDGIERDRIRGIVRELGLSDVTTFPNSIENADLPAYYAAADVCVVPSQYELFGMVAIESMASRTPVVASDVGGLPFTVVPEVTGLLAPPQDEEAFARAIDRILDNPDWRDELGRMGRHRVEIAFSWYSVASRLSILYSKLLSAQSVPVSAIESPVAA